MKNTFLAATFIILLLGGFHYYFPGFSVSSSDSIKVGALFDLSSDAADWGKDELRAVQLAVTEINQSGGINGKNIELVVEDAPALDPKRTISAFNKLIFVDKVVAVIGPNWDNAAAAIAPIADENHIPVLAPDVSLGVEKDISYDFLFSFWYPQDTEMKKLASYAKNIGVNRFSVIRNIDPYSQITFELFESAAQEAGIEIVSEYQIIDPGVKDYRTEISKLKRDSVDGVFFIFQDPATKCPAVRQLKELDVRAVLFTDSAADVVDCKEVLEGVTYAFPSSTEKGAALNEQFTEIYGSAPATPAVPNAYDAMILLAEIMEKDGISGDAIQRGLLVVRNYSGAVSSKISFSGKGNVQFDLHGFTIKTITNGVPIKVQ